MLTKKLAAHYLRCVAMPNGGTTGIVPGTGRVGDGMFHVATFPTEAAARAALERAGFVECGRQWKPAELV